MAATQHISIGGFPPPGKIVRLSGDDFAGLTRAEAPKFQAREWRRAWFRNCGTVVAQQGGRALLALFSDAAPPARQAIRNELIDQLAGRPRRIGAVIAACFEKQMAFDTMVGELA
jgi:hypothetical protein